MEEKQASFTGWAKVEVMGHQTHIGFVRTEPYGQAVLFRIDVPPLPERDHTLTAPCYVNGILWTPAGAVVRRLAVEGHSVLVGAASIYRIIPCTEEAALKGIESEYRSELKVVSVPPKALEQSEENFPEESDEHETDDEDEEVTF